MKLEQVPNTAFFEYFPAQFENAYRSFLDVQIFSIKHSKLINYQKKRVFLTIFVCIFARHKIEFIKWKSFQKSFYKVD